ncbi:pyridoxal phosphate-dependent aminotransferase [Bryobacter aggregatus]|uniref:pyridoxal phosphate-dependent aminotransferase n=1 Tax=Bryobacter aggregatus TaxID=360054 RepID=UPI0004E0E628|nr:aminotransferase class I/II-fold pyridoxal phosphate-dependent enzyme [Bryobacter aggregatus]
MISTELSSGVPTRRALYTSEKTSRFTESVIREMSRQALKFGAVNLAQGFPDFPAPEEIKAAARNAIDADINQYAITWGAKLLRDAIANRYKKAYAFPVDPEREITVVCGATEGMMASLMAILNPGDEVIIFEPFYENYGPDIHLSGGAKRTVKLQGPDWSFDREELRRAFSGKTKAIVINSPNNPSGKVFTREELTSIAELCQEFDVIAITDEIYEYITYDGAVHIPIATLPGMRDRSILINSMSKTFSVTGWRVGWVIAPPHLTDSIRKVHDFLTVGAAAPLQAASAIALGASEDYYVYLSSSYTERRARLLGYLNAAGFRTYQPAGAYYIMTDISGFGFRDDLAFAKHLLENVGVIGVPGSSFYSEGGGSQQMRFCFCKRFETLDGAGEKLAKLR